MATRAEHRSATLRKLSEATIDAMEEHGPDVPLEEIAARAGVTRRTIYRWVDARDDLVFIHPLLWLDEFDQAVAAVADSSLLERLHVGSERVCKLIDDDPTPVLRSMRLAMSHPQLMRGYSAVSQQWIDRMAEEVRADAEDANERFRARVLGAAVMGVIDAALLEWSTTEPTPRLWPLVASGLGHLAPILDP